MRSWMKVVGSSVVGTMVWVLCHNGNNYVGLCGGIMMACVLLVCLKCKKHINYKEIIICMLICFIMIIIAEYIALGIHIHEVFKVQGIDRTIALTRVPEFLGFHDVFQETMQHVLLGYGCVMILGVSTALYIKKR